MTYSLNTTRLSGICRLAAASLALSLSACGGSGDDTGTGTNATTSTSDATTGGGTGTTTTATTGDVTTGGTTTTTTATTGDVTTGGTTTTTTATTGDGSTGGGTTSAGSTGNNVEPSMSFFVSSTGSATGDLGGLAGADQRCQDLADAAGAGDRTWHAYLSVEDDGNGQPIHARDRIGQGPWYNAKLVMLAANLDELHTLDGDHTLFLDENGEMVPGQWPDSPDPNEHDILTGTNKDGTVAAGKTCQDWTSGDAMLFAQVGHSDGLGPNGSDAEQYRSWNSVHESGGCNDTAPKGGAGRVYCFAID